MPMKVSLSHHVLPDSQITVIVIAAEYSRSWSIVFQPSGTAGKARKSVVKKERSLLPMTTRQRWWGSLSSHMHAWERRKRNAMKHSFIATKECMQWVMLSHWSDRNGGNGMKLQLMLRGRLDFKQSESQGNFVGHQLFAKGHEKWGCFFHFMPYIWCWIKVTVYSYSTVKHQASSFSWSFHGLAKRRDGTKAICSLFPPHDWTSWGTHEKISMLFMDFWVCFCCESWWSNYRPPVVCSYLCYAAGILSQSSHNRSISIKSEEMRADQKSVEYLTRWWLSGENAVNLSDIHDSATSATTSIRSW